MTRYSEPSESRDLVDMHPDMVMFCHVVVAVFWGVWRHW